MIHPLQTLPLHRQQMLLLYALLRHTEQTFDDVAMSEASGLYMIACQIQQAVICNCYFCLAC
jgi:hypothetical protein